MGDTEVSLRRHFVATRPKELSIVFSFVALDVEFRCHDMGWR
jgi:hypothetical protein